jgi:hypothetical protein
VVGGNGRDKKILIMKGQVESVLAGQQPSTGKEDEWVGRG